MKETPSANQQNGWMHTLKELNEEQSSFISSCLTFGEKFLKLAGPDVTLHNHTPEHLEQLIAWWKEGDLIGSDIDTQTFIHVTGALFGHYLNREYNGYWTAHVDQSGIEYASHTDLEKLKFHFYPFSTIRCIVESNTGSLSDIIRLIEGKK